MLHIVLTSYRSNPHCGGQGVYVRHLSRELTALGHRVEVISGQPYPHLDRADITLTRLPSLDLYNEAEPFRRPGMAEIRDWIDVVEWAYMRTGGFAEPLTFSLRLYRALSGRAGRADIVHDNQTLGYGMLRLRRLGVPMVTSIHHPISRDRLLAVDSARGLVEHIGARRWYGFVRMQSRVARQAGRVLTVSQASKRAIADDFGVDPARMHVVPLGVDTRVFHPHAHAGGRVPGRITAIASADSPLKGVDVLLEAMAMMTARRDMHLCLVGSIRPGGPAERLLADQRLRRRVSVHRRLSEAALASLLASAQVAVVPSRYEGFSLPALEHMASGTPLIVTDAGALPEVVGDAALKVAAGDAEQLAEALLRLSGSPSLRDRLAEAGQVRVRQRYTWPAVARATVALYEQEIAAAGSASKGRRGHRDADR